MIRVERNRGLGRCQLRRQGEDDTDVGRGEKFAAPAQRGRQLEDVQ